jgi:hypothetical protein
MQQGWSPFVEMGPQMRFGDTTIGSAASLEEHGWTLEPNNFLDVSSSDGCVALRRYSRNSMLTIYHDLPSGEHDYVIAWGGERCQLTLVSERPGSPEYRGRVETIYQGGSTLEVTHATVNSSSYGGQIRFEAQPSAVCKIACALARAASLSVHARPASKIDPRAPAPFGHSPGPDYQHALSTRRHPPL